MYFSGSSLKRHTKGSEKECAAEEKKSLRSRERGREEEEEEGSILSLSFSSLSCRRLSAARILRNSQTRGLNLLLSFPLPPLSLLSFLSMHRFLLALIPSSASFLFLLHPLLLLWPHSLLCSPPFRHRSCSILQPLVFRLLSPCRFFHPLARETPSFQSPFYSSGLFTRCSVRLRLQSRVRPRVFDYLSCVLLLGIFSPVPVYPSVAAPKRGSQSAECQCREHVRRMMDSVLLLLFFPLYYFFFLRFVLYLIVSFLPFVLSSFSIFRSIFSRLLFSLFFPLFFISLFFSLCCFIRFRLFYLLSDGRKRVVALPDGKGKHYSKRRCIKDGESRY